MTPTRSSLQAEPPLRSLRSLCGAGPRVSGFRRPLTGALEMSSNPSPLQCHSHVPEKTK